jgi:hypothetical protein
MEDKSISMLSRFDKTSSIDIHPISNNLLQNRLFQHDVARNLEILNFDLSVLGWFMMSVSPCTAILICASLIHANKVALHVLGL